MISRYGLWLKFLTLKLLNYLCVILDKKRLGYYLHNKAAVFVNWALPGLVAAFVNVGCVMAANAARFCTVIGGRRPAAAAAAVAAAVSAVFVCAPKPIK